MHKVRADVQVVQVGPIVSLAVQFLHYVQLALLVALDRDNALLVLLDIIVSKDRQLLISVWQEAIVFQVPVHVQLVHLVASALQVLFNRHNVVLALTVSNLRVNVLIVLEALIVLQVHLLLHSVVLGHTAQIDKLNVRCAHQAHSA